MSSPQGRTRGALLQSDDEAVSMIGQKVWFVDQIEPVGVVRNLISLPDGRVIGFAIEDERSRMIRRVQASRVRKYGDRHFLVTKWFARTDESAKELERQLARGFPRGHPRDFWDNLPPEIVTKHLLRMAPSTYAVVGQLATASDGLGQDLARASVHFRRVQRAIVSNQTVMSPGEYAEFLDESRKWARTIRLVLMSLEFYSRAVPHALIDLRNPDAPLPAGPLYIPHEALLPIHTPAGEGMARPELSAETIRHEEESFVELEGANGAGWDEVEAFQAAGEAGALVAEEFTEVKPLREYEEEPIPGEGFGGESFEPVLEAETFEPVAEDVAQFEEVPPQPEALVEFEVVREPVAPPPAPAQAAKRAAPAKPASRPPSGAPTPPPPPAKGTVPAAPKIETLPEEEEEIGFRPAPRATEAGRSWLTPPPPPPPPAPATAREVTRQEKTKDKPDLESIIAASLGKTPKKAASKTSQGEVAPQQEMSSPTESLSRELASLLEKSKRK